MSSELVNTMVSALEFDQQMDSKGFFIFKKVLPEKLLIRLRKEIDLGIETDKKNNHTRGNYSYILQNKGESFIELLNFSPLQPYIDSVLSKNCILHSYNSIKLEPFVDNEIQGNIHRDSPRYSRQLILAIQILYMVDDFTAENGATFVLPGSHKVESKPSIEDFHANAIQLQGKAGDAVVFDSMLWHSSGKNATSYSRRGITKVFSRAFMKQQIDYTKATDKSVLTQINEQARRLLGFNARVPENIEQFMLPSSERLYKPNQG